jgi:tryptophan synthase alpha chain
MALAFLFAATSVAAQTPIAPDKAYSMLSGMATPGVAIGRLVDEVAAALEAGSSPVTAVLARVKALGDAVRGARVAETV